MDAEGEEWMPKVKKGDRSKRSGHSEMPVLKANPEELTKAVARATEVLGDEEAAFRWVGTPVAALDYSTPISCLATQRGAMRVNDVLTQIEHGVW